MDLSKLSTEDTHFDDAVECPLYTATGEPETDSAGNPVVVLVVGDHSKAARRIAQIQRQKIAQLVRRYGSWEAIPQADLDALENEKIAACITGFRGFESAGQPLPYSPKAAVDIVAGLRTYRPTTLRQIEGAISAHASFFTKGSAT